jgi:hypothetical protein
LLCACEDDANVSLGAASAVGFGRGREQMVHLCDDHHLMEAG